MTLRRPLFTLACGAALCGAVAAQTSARPTGNLRIAVQILANCRPAAHPAPGSTSCLPAEQRSDASHPVPPQVQALTPSEPDAESRPDRVTVTY